ncbi:hypothetical protein Bca101_019560 [Brassica carinata]
MKFEGRNFNEIAYSGTIVKVEDFSINWKDSEWRRLQVQWDEAATIPRPNKVHMESDVRTVDLTAFDGYNHMIVELEKLFNIKGKLHNQWKLTFKDNEGDMVLVRGDQWPEFCNIVKEIFICSKHDAIK